MPGVTFQIKGKHFVRKLCAGLFNLTLGARGQQALTVSLNLVFTALQFAFKQCCLSPVELGNQLATSFLVIPHVASKGSCESMWHPVCHMRRQS